MSKPREKRLNCFLGLVTLFDILHVKLDSKDCLLPETSNVKCSWFRQLLVSFSRSHVSDHIKYTTLSSMALQSTSSGVSYSVSYPVFQTKSSFYRQLQFDEQITAFSFPFFCCVSFTSWGTYLHIFWTPLVAFTKTASLIACHV